MPRRTAAVTWLATACGLFSFEVCLAAGQLDADRAITAQAAPCLAAYRTPAPPRPRGRRQGFRQNETGDSD